ncbi:MAG: MFS transporter [Deltaproteobacteria bacterium]|jgi:MFS family permease|nr:MFS transporter [Deltaproteobacteria bacterium]
MAREPSDIIPHDPGYAASGTLWTGAFVTFLAVYFFTFTCFYMQFSTLAPYLASEGLSETLAGFVIGSFTVTSIASRLLSAPLAVRVGALRTARVGLAVIGFGIIFFFVRPEAGFFAAARLLMGAGFGLVSTLLVSLVVKIIPHERLGEGLGYMGLGSTVAMAAGPLAGLEISRFLGYRDMFLAMDLMVAVSLLVTLRLPRFLEARETAPPPPAPGSPGGRRRFDQRPVWPGSLALFYGAGVTAVTVYLAVYCEHLRLPSAADFFVVSTIGTAAARFTTGKIYDRKGPNYVIPPAALVLAASLAGILMARGPSLLFLSALGYGAAAGAIFPALQSLTISSVEDSRRTVAAATFFVFYDLGFGVGVVALGYLADRFDSYSAAFVGSLCFIAALLVGYPFVMLRSRRLARKARLKAPGAPPNKEKARTMPAPARSPESEDDRPKAPVTTAAEGKGLTVPAPASNPEPETARPKAQEVAAAEGKGLAMPAPATPEPETARPKAPVATAEEEKG